jgi:hypothetical protein
MVIRAFQLTAATLGFCVMLAPAAFAGQATYTGPNGRSTVVNTTRQKTDNGFTTDRTTTYPNGKTSSSTGNFVRTGDNSYQRDRVYTGPNGNQTTVNGSGAYQNGVASGQRTVTYPNGQSRTGSYQYKR